MSKVVLAIGGNAIIKEGQKGTLEEQVQNIVESCDPVLDLLNKVTRLLSLTEMDRKLGIH